MKIFDYKLHKDREVLVIQEPEEKYLLVQINIVLLAFKKPVVFAITKAKGVCWLLHSFQQNKCDHHLLGPRYKYDLVKTQFSKIHWGKQVKGI